MELKDEADQFAPLLCKLVVGQMQYGLRFDGYPAPIGRIEKTEDVQQCTLAAAGRPDYSVHASGLDLKRHAPQCVHAFFLFAKVALDLFATETDFWFHLDPRIVTTGASSAARRAGT